MSTVEEFHGVFQFTDDLFEDTQPVERVLTVDKVYEPREIYPKWFENEAYTLSNSTDDTIDTTEFHIPHLYQTGSYEECLELSLKRIKKYSSSSGVVRDAAETASLCLLKLSRANEALPLLPLMTGVEEPGRLIVRSRVYFDCKLFSECIDECRQYLNLRPGDYLISLRLAECLLKLDQPQHSEEIKNILDYCDTTLSSYIQDSTLSCNLKFNYAKDLDRVKGFKQDLK